MIMTMILGKYGYDLKYDHIMSMTWLQTLMGVYATCTIMNELFPGM